MPKLSIIVPIYNSEKYLHDCLNSILQQTFTDFELILVNDGSTDSSKQICEEFERNDKRIILFNTENRGAAAARKLGLEKAKGVYIGWVDSDDYIHQEMYYDLYRSIIENKSDIAICGIKQQQKNSEVKEILPDAKKFENNLYKNPVILFSYCNKLFNKELFFNKIIEFPVGLVMYEDPYVLFRLLCITDKVSFVLKPHYFYRFAQGSVVNSFNIKHIEDMIFVAKSFEEFCLLNGINKYNNFIQYNKYISKSYYIMSSDYFNPKLWRNTFQEVNNYKSKYISKKYRIVTFFVNSRFDFIFYLYVAFKKVYRNMKTFILKGLLHE